MVGGAGGGVFTQITPRKFQASQAFLMRDEFSGQILRPGRFESLEAMKSAQETIQEIARNSQLISNVLEEVGPETWFADAENYPSVETIEDFQGEVWISAANGAELGKTEVIHLNVRASSKERAKKIVDLLAAGVETELKTLRGLKAKSFEEEAKASFEVASQQMETVTNRLKKMETELGADLGELRALENPASGDSIIRRSLIQINSDLIKQRSSLNQLDQQGVFFREAIKSQNATASIPFEMLQMLPSIREFQLGLVRSKLRLSQVESEYKSGHYKVQKAQNEVKEIEKHIKKELQNSYKTIRDQRRFVERRIKTLESQKSVVEKRMTRLANLRTPYHNLIQESQIATTRVNDAQKDLNWARASLHGSETVDLLTRLETSQVRSRPVGLSKTVMMLGSITCGLFVGLGLVMFLSAPGATVSQNRMEEMASENEQSE